MVNVNTQVLQDVKSHLTDFQERTKDVASKANGNMNDILSECQGHIRSSKNDVEESKKLIEGLQKEIISLAEAILIHN